MFALNVKSMANFYEKVVGVSPAPRPGDSKKDIRLGENGQELLIHSIPSRIAKSIVIQTPPIPREESAMKPVFDVQSLSYALEQVSILGGLVTDRTFTMDGQTRRDIVDPEGNVVQLRSSAL